MEYAKLQETHHFPAENDHVTNSISFISIFILWLKYLQNADHSKAALPKQQNPLKRRSIFLRLDDYEPEEIIFTGPLNEHHEPHGPGILKLPITDSTEVCYRQTCEKLIAAINGTFDNGLITGFATVAYVDGSTLMGIFQSGTLHGYVIERNEHGALTFAGFYENGKKDFATSCQFVPHFDVAVYNNKALLSYLNGSDIFALTGKFSRGVFEGKGDLKRVKSVSFKENGYIMSLEFEDLDDNELQSYDYELHRAPNIRNNAGKISAQAAWLGFARYDQKEPRGAIKDLEKITDFLENSKRNVTRTFPEELGEECAKYKTCRNCAKDSLRTRYLACFPGTGSKWLANKLMVSFGLGMEGCQYQDHNLVPGGSIFIKTHHQNPDRWMEAISVLSKYHGRKWSRGPEELQFRLKDMAKVHGRALLIIRNPYEAIISLWNHEKSNSYDSKSNYGVVNLKESLKNANFADYAKTEIQLWEEIYLDYLSLGTDLLVVHYEDMKISIENEIRRVADYLQIPIDENRLKCAMKTPEGEHKRNPQPLIESPFTEEHHKMFEEAITRVQKFLQLRNQPRLPVERYKWKRTNFVI